MNNINNVNVAGPVMPRVQTAPLPGVDDAVPQLAPGLKIAADAGVAARADWAAGPEQADIDNVNLDAAELRALDNMMQTYLADGNLSKEEQKTYQEVRDLFARPGYQAPPPAATNPAGGSVPVPPATPQPTDLWSVGEKGANGRTFKSWGDPHEVSGDGVKFDNMKTGTFTKLASASGDFEVQTTQAKDASGRWPGATLNHKAAIKDGKDVVTYDGLAKTMTINGKQVAMPKNGESVALPGGGKVVGTADGIQVQTSKGDKVNIHQKDKYIDISGEVSANRKDGEVRGSLGAFDADTNGGNDLVGRDGKQYNAGDAKSLDAFLEDWRVKPGQDLFAADPAGGGGPKVDPFDADVQAEFKARDKTANGYLSGNEIPADYKAANPGKDRVTMEDFLAFRKKQEADAAAKDKGEFGKRDVNGDFQLDGNEVGDAAKYDRGGNWQRPDGTSQTEVTDMEYYAGKANERRAARWADLGGAPANPPAGGGANPPGGGAPPVATDDPKKKPPKPTIKDMINTNKDLAAFRKADRNNDGALTGANTLKKYGKFDANNDGKVTAEEFLAGRAKARAEAEFKKADRNKDGTLTGEQTLKKYGAYDANNDGKVTKEEYVAGRLGQTEDTREKAAEHVKQDKNQDGKISFWEKITYAADEEEKRKKAQGK